jgi:hypothetical protein
MSIVAEWKTLADDVRDAGLRIFETASVARTHKGFADEKILSLMLLARTISNLKGAVLLLAARRIVEARTITRCCLEKNLYWTVGLAEEGESFARKMRDDEMSHRKALGQSIFATEVQLEEEVASRLRNFMKGANSQFASVRSLSPKQVAEIRPDFEKTYIFYGHLCLSEAQTRT